MVTASITSYDGTNTLSGATTAIESLGFASGDLMEIYVVGTTAYVVRVEV